MPFLTNNLDIEHYKDLFSEIWSSAVLTVSITELSEKTIPNGELVFRRDSLSETEDILYKENDFKIVRKIVENPFQLMKQISKGNLIIDGEEMSFETDFPNSTSISNFFQKGNDSKVFEDRPIFELNSLVWLKADESTQQEYEEKLEEEVNNKLKTADEPYYKVSDCEITYFDYYFSKMKDKKPKILLFADTGIRCGIDEENTLMLECPEDILNDISICIYPNRPHGENKGRKITLSDEDLEKNTNVKLEKDLELTGIETLQYSLFVGDEMLNFHRHVNQKLEITNRRVKLMEKFDQKSELVNYLEGKKPDLFEEAVLNLMAIAGYKTQWFGDTQFQIPNHSRETEELKYDEIDIIAHSPDNEILFIECTNKKISEKSDLPERMQRIVSDWDDEKEEIFMEGFTTVDSGSYTACIATPMSNEEVPEAKIENLKEEGVKVLFQEDLKNILLRSARNSDYVEISEPNLADNGFETFI